MRHVYIYMYVRVCLCIYENVYVTWKGWGIAPNMAGVIGSQLLIDTSGLTAHTVSILREEKHGLASKLSISR